MDGLNKCAQNFVHNAKVAKSGKVPRQIVYETPMKILFLNELHPYLLQTLRAMGMECDEAYQLSEAEIAQIIHQYEGIVIKSRIYLGKELLDQATKLRFIARAGAGMESIDVAYAQSRGIACINSPEGNRDAVGEHALGMLLALFNRICLANREVKSGIWRREPNRGEEVMGKTVGILGYGNMGNAFAQRLAGFGARVIAYDKYKTDYGNAYAQQVTESQLFAETDILSLHIPWLPENDRLINDAYINRFAKSIYIINTARGKVLHTPDLVKNLKSGKVRAAALDVLEYEHISFDAIPFQQLPDAFQYLAQAENVLLTPHVAGWTQQSALKHAQTLARKIKKVDFHFHKNT